MSIPDFSESPRWSANSKRFVVICLMIAALLILYRVHGLLLPFVMAVILAYLVEPLVRLIHKRIRMPRILIIVIIYLLIIAFLVAIPISAIPPIVGQVNLLIKNFPSYIFKIGVLVQELQDPIVITEDIVIPLDAWQLDQAFLT